MIPNAKVCLYPHDPAEAVRVLSGLGKRALILAGGTSAALVRDPGIDTLVDVTRMGLDTIERRPEEIVIGCNVRLQQLAEDAGIGQLAGGLLAAAAASVGSRPIRNAVTVGGNLVQLYRWSDPPCALLALDAVVDLLGPQGERSLTLDELLARHPKQVLGEAELLLGVRVPLVAGRVGAFLKYSRTAVDYSVLDAAVCLDMAEGRCVAARVVVGGARGRPFRVAEAERLLAGGKPTRARMASAAAAARQATRAIPDTRTSSAYRTRMVEVIVRRAIEQAAAHAREA